MRPNIIVQYTLSNTIEHSNMRAYISNSQELFTSHHHTPKKIHFFTLPKKTLFNAILPQLLLSIAPTYVYEKSEIDELCKNRAPLVVHGKLPLVTQRAPGWLVVLLGFGSSVGRVRNWFQNQVVFCPGSIFATFSVSGFISSSLWKLLVP